MKFPNRKIGQIFSFLPLIILFSGCTSVLSVSSNPRYLTLSPKYHIVRKGETLSQISKMYSISEKKLQMYNNLKSEKIFPGQKIYLHPKPYVKRDYLTARPIPKTKYYIVKPKETIYRIAKMFNLDFFDIVEFNNLTSLSVHAGEKLWLEKGHFSKSENKKNKIGKKEKVSKPKPIEKKTDRKPETEEPKNISQTKLSLIIPVNGTVSSEFGIRNGRMHKGIDIVAKIGEPIHAVSDGKVAFVGHQKGYGNVVILEHKNYVMTVYAHNETNLVRLGDEVKQGQPIATVGNSGNSTGSHLHFEYRIKGKAINPRKVLPHF